ncbi:MULTISPECIES: hypothetical protein [unclassified Micromonospora]|uniref:hypothetical protein n=1 Tax=unclassified Micromonospora TaxID=2617518 RepID=UPI001C223BAD|nr:MULTISPECIES: hypothetical protein [unclassified Micromonospora]MBU8857786.1 hypothetical protein [Micromonospora sp. WMMB482]MDM4783416.1 hypothetical protein [Micromonospora sp. b486]
MRMATHSLPEPDLRALLAVVLVVHAELRLGELPEGIFTRLARRLTTDGLIPRAASKGEVNALLGDLGQRLHWAMNPNPDQAYPRPAPRQVTHSLLFAAGEAAARGFLVSATALGGTDAWVRREPRPGTEEPGGANTRGGSHDVWLVDVAFAELPPDPDFVARRKQLAALAADHGGRYIGSHS